MSFAGKPSSFYKNIYCSHPGINPVQTTGCWDGLADCRLSCSIYGHKMIVEENSMMIWPALQRTNAYAFNQTMVEKRWAKCSFLWDGTTNQKYFRGCGTGAPGCCEEGCGAAFYNICPSTGKPCTWEDAEIKAGACKQFGGKYETPLSEHLGFQCFYPGPAIEYHEQVPAEEWKWSGDASTGTLRQMLQDRVKYNCKDEANGIPGKNSQGWNLRKHNEVVLDELLLLPDLMKDPAVVIPAVLYTKKGGAQAKKFAEEMSAEIGKVTGLDKEFPGKSIPAIAIHNMYPYINPFYVEPNEPAPAPSPMPEICPRPSTEFWT